MLALKDIKNNHNFFKQFGLHQINHYAFVCNDMSNQLNILEQDNMMNTWYRPKLKSYQYFENSNPVNYTISDLVFGYTSSKQIEVIQAVSTENNIFGLSAKKGSSFHHYGFAVHNVETATQIFNDAGYKTVNSGLFKTKSKFVTKLTFVDTVQEIGAYTELVESRLMGIRIPQNKFLLDFGVVLGDVDKFVTKKA